jgi:hypothetical protein
VTTVIAPWNDREIASLAEFQHAHGHPYTCGSGHILMPTRHGWRCPVDPDFEQEWAHEWSADWRWLESLAHDGPYHEVGSKKGLAIHIGFPHVGPDGRTRRVATPTAAYRSRWRRDELEREHRSLHDPDGT